MLISEFRGLERLDELSRLYAGKNILLVTGKESFNSCGAKKIIEAKLKKENVIYFNNFSINPKVEDAIVGTNIARTKNIEVIIAVGGGSVIDTAKLIKGFFNAEGKEAELLKGDYNVIDSNIPIIAIPTTAGSGSESTHFAVAYIGSNKYSLASKCLLPKAVILDGALTLSGSKYQKTCNALDAMAQGIESAWASNSSAESIKYSFDSLELGWDIFINFIQPSCSDKIAQKMIVASNLAGKAINISKTTSAHAWSYAFTSFYDIPHGHAIWLTLPAIFHAHSIADRNDIIHPKGQKYLFSIINMIKDKLNLEKNTNIEKQLNSFLNKIDIKYRMEDLGLDTIKKRSWVSKQINIERMMNNPVDLNTYKSEIFRIKR